jgi:hypothetical protein
MTDSLPCHASLSVACVLLQVLGDVYNACETQPDAARVAAVVTLLSDTLHALRAGQPLPAAPTSSSSACSPAAQLPVAWDVRPPTSARVQLKFSHTDMGAVPVLSSSLEDQQLQALGGWKEGVCSTTDTGEAWLHAKLMSPERKKKSPSETARMVEEKQRRAERTRER